MVLSPFTCIGLKLGFYSVLKFQTLNCVCNFITIGLAVSFGLYVCTFTWVVAQIVLRICIVLKLHLRDLFATKSIAGRKHFQHPTLGHFHHAQAMLTIKFVNRFQRIAVCWLLHNYCIWVKTLTTSKSLALHTLKLEILDFFIQDNPWLSITIPEGISIEVLVTTETQSVVFVTENRCWSRIKDALLLSVVPDVVKQE